jgi:hypothetical protein
MENKHVITLWAIGLGVIVSAGLSLGADFGFEWLGWIPHGSLIISPLIALAVLFYRTLFNVLGSFIAAYLAPHYPMLHALVLGVIGIIIRFFGIAVSAKLNSSPAWYVWALFLLAMPAALLGGELAAKLRAALNKT